MGCSRFYVLRTGCQWRELPEVKPILELNPNHPLIVGLKDASDQTLEDTAHVLFAQSLLLEGAEIPDRVDFVKRLNRLLG